MAVEKSGDKKLKMLILTSSFPRRSGDFAGLFVEDFARALADNFQITILTPASRDQDIIELQPFHLQPFQIERFNYLWPRRLQQLDAAVDLQPLLERSWSARLQVIPFGGCFFWRALRLARDTDIICSHWLLPAGLIGAILARLLGKKHLAIEHSGALHLLRRLRFGSLLTKIIVRGSARIVVVSAQLRDYMIALSPAAASKTDVIPMGIDYHQFQRSIPIAEHQVNDRKRVLFLGRLTAIKGVKTLIDAVADEIDCELIIAGDGEDRESLIEYARTRNVAAQFIGAVTGKAKIELLQRADIVVIPSIELATGRSEGLPVVCLEAFAAGRAVIAAAVGGLPGLIVDGETGLLFEPGNSAQLRSSIIKLLNDDEARKKLGERAAQLAVQYDWQQIAEQYKAVMNR